METSHRIKYEGLELEVFGNWEEPEEETGCKGGWSTEKIMLDEVEVSWMFTPYVLSMIASCVIIENY
jgi:hypothetical protein